LGEATEATILSIALAYLLTKRLCGPAHYPYYRPNACNTAPAKLTEILKAGIHKKVPLSILIEIGINGPRINMPVGVSANIIANDPIVFPFALNDPAIVEGELTIPGEFLAEEPALVFALALGVRHSAGYLDALGVDALELVLGLVLSSILLSLL